MMKSITLAQAYGKVLMRSVTEDSYTIMVWTDGTVTLLRAKSGYDGEVEIAESTGDILEYIDDSMAVKAGLMTIEEVNQRRQSQLQHEEAKRLAREREQYEKLKVKFENKEYKA